MMVKGGSCAGVSSVGGAAGCEVGGTEDCWGTGNEG